MSSRRLRLKQGCLSISSICLPSHVVHDLRAKSFTSVILQLFWLFCKRIFLTEIGLMLFIFLASLCMVEGFIGPLPVVPGNSTDVSFQKSNVTQKRRLRRTQDSTSIQLLAQTIFETQQNADEADRAAAASATRSQISAVTTAGFGIASQTIGFVQGDRTGEDVGNFVIGLVSASLPVLTAVFPAAGPLVAAAGGFLSLFSGAFQQMAEPSLQDIFEERIRETEKRLRAEVIGALATVQRAAAEGAVGEAVMRLTDLESLQEGARNNSIQRLAEDTRNGLWRRVFADVCLEGTTNSPHPLNRGDEDSRLCRGFLWTSPVGYQLEFVNMALSAQLEPAATLTPLLSRFCMLL